MGSQIRSMIQVKKLSKGPQTVLLTGLKMEPSTNQVLYKQLSSDSGRHSVLSSYSYSFFSTQLLKR